MSRVRRVAPTSAVGALTVLIALLTASCVDSASNIGDSSVADTTTTVEAASDVTLAPEGAFPVLTPEQAKADDLEPGTYRIRLEHQAGWPERCLGEMLVFPRPGDNGTVAPSDSVPSTTLDPGWESVAIARQDRTRELQATLCDPFRFGEQHEQSGGDGGVVLNDD